MQWYNVHDYALLKNVSQSTVRKYASSGKVTSKKVDGKLMVALNENTIDEKQKQTADEKKINMALKAMKIKQLDAEIKLKKQRYDAYKNAMRQQMCEKIFETFVKDFSPFKGYFQAMKLNPKQVEDLLYIYDNCLQVFADDLRVYAKGEDNESIEEIDQESY